ncbi:MAG: efflux RND transporter periplasmic adaptor subunit [Pseudomonadota bacterium]
MPKWYQGLVVTLAIVMMILGAAIFGFMQLAKMRPPAQTKPPAETAPLVEVLELNAGSVAFEISSQGTVAPVTETTLSAEVAGTVVELSSAFEAGGTFRAGQMLMRIDPTNYEVAVARAQATLSQRQVEYDGAKKLREQGYRAEAELLSAKAALESARADLVRAERDLQRTRVVVPYDGLVRSRAAELGDYVAPGSQLGSVFATDRFEVRLPIPDTDLAFVDLPRSGASGDRVRPSVVLRGRYRGDDAEWPAEIVRTEGVVDERTRMVFAVASIADPYRMTDEAEVPLPAGTFVDAAIEGVTLDSVVKIPRTLIRGNDQVVFVDDESQLRLRNLEFIRSDAEYAYVSADQIQETRVVTTVLEAPLNGLLVRVRDDVASPDEVVSTSEEGAPGSGIAATGQ